MQAGLSLTVLHLMFMSDAVATTTAIVPSAKHTFNGSDRSPGRVELYEFAFDVRGVRGGGGGLSSSSTSERPERGGSGSSQSSVSDRSAGGGPGWFEFEFEVDFARLQDRLQCFQGAGGRFGFQFALTSSWMSLSCFPKGAYFEFEFERGSPSNGSSYTYTTYVCDDVGDVIFCEQDHAPWMKCPPRSSLPT